MQDKAPLSSPSHPKQDVRKRVGASSSKTAREPAAAAAQSVKGKPVKGGDAGQSTTAGSQGSGRGFKIEPYFTTPGVDPYDQVDWDLRVAAITGDGGKVYFEQRDVEVPSSWSQTAVNVVVHKYFRGVIGSPTRERSVKQLIGRVVNTITDWGIKDGFFATAEDAETYRAELTHLLVEQKMAFNSPVWFNVGVEEHPQCSACFINSVDDTMEGILTLAKTEGMLFKWGSGTGTNFSTLRSSKELLNGGGTASGPVSFMKGFDAFAGVIKSGGKTRRAAKMVILNADHPDIVDFIWCKAGEERKAWALIDAGFDGGFNVPGGAYDSISYQNANHSVRVTDEFMQAAVADREWRTHAVSKPGTTGATIDTYRAKDLFHQLSEAAHQCGDPGMQFDTIINSWHTCPETARINASNPCVTGDTLVATKDGLMRIDALLEQGTEVVGADGRLHPIRPAFPTGTKPVYRLRTKAGFELSLTADHRVLTANRGDVPAHQLTKDDVLLLGRPTPGIRRLDDRLGEFLGMAVGDGCLMGEQQTAMLTLSPDEQALAAHLHESITSYKREYAADARAARDIEVTQPQGTLRLGTSARCVVDELNRFAVLDQGSAKKRFTPAIFQLDEPSVAAVLRGLFTADGTVAHYGEKSQYVALDSTSLELLAQTQLLLLGLGIKAKLYRERRVLGQTMALLPDGKSGRKEYPVDQIHSLRISRASRVLFEQKVGFVKGSAKVERLATLNREVGTYADRFEDAVDSMTFLGEQPVYDLTEPATSHFVANGLVVHNCSEYMFLDDSACNLASINLMKFESAEGTFDVEGFKRAVELTILAQEIIVDNAKYPTEQIRANSHAYRPLGLGYANLGALLMSRGLPYDSDAGRSVAGAITAVMTGWAYATSAKISRDVTGPFEGYEKNRQPFIGVMEKHRRHVDQIDSAYVPYDLMDAARTTWDEAIRVGREHGYRNAQATVLAPTGTIGFMMDCDTTGIEPDIALVKYKRLVGGGMMKIVNQTVPTALRTLGYEESEVNAIIDYIDQNETIEGAPGLLDEHLAVFDCAFRAQSGTRSIHYMGHVRMMAAAQPFLSGAISKTVNLPTDCSIEDIEDAYLEAWRLGLKAIAVYRDGCKRTQPLSTGKSAVAKATAELAAAVVEVNGPPKAVRRKLPEERQSITHKFSIAGHEGYIHVGMYEDGSPGEIFIRMAKQGSTISGLMDSFATAVSLALQHGVPLRLMADKFRGTKFDPSGFTGNPEVPRATSIMDYIFRWLSAKFLKDEMAEQLDLPGATARALSSGKVGGGSSGGAQGGAGGSGGTSGSTGGVKARGSSGPLVVDMTGGASAEAQSDGRGEQPGYSTFVTSSDAPPCIDCGHIMVRNGACYKCLNCGTTSGCS